MKINSSLIFFVIGRSLFAILAIWLFSAIAEPHTGYTLLIIASLIGIAIGVKIATTKLNFKGFSLITSVSIAIIYLLSKNIAFLDTFIPIKPFFFQTISDHLILITTILFFWIISSFLSLRSYLYILIEVTLGIFGSSYLLSSHRNFHFDSPRIISDISWYLGITELSGFIITGCIIFCGLLIYLFFSVNRDSKDSLNSTFKEKIAAIGSSLAIIIILLTIVTTGIYQVISPQVAKLTGNGVGESNGKKGDKPLNFESSLGGSATPTALVRLENDYDNNPWSPLLYLRETALSVISKESMQSGEANLYPDVSNTTPTQKYRRSNVDHSSEQRLSLQYSVYLLSPSNSTITIDFPVSIEPIATPNNSRFKSAYRVQSLVPIFSLNDIKKYEIGNSKWSKEIKDHFTAPHPNPKYAEFAKKITSNSNNKIDKILDIQNFLNKNAIYTLKPNHQLNQDKDPVIPFLFGDLRGYCVHFAHATVYLLRSLGIPARVATGYMTDLSQAKDGHILLRMNDRHAWAETYINKIGWIPIDTQPEKVENHAQEDVDQKLLEELMGIIGPENSILDEDILNEITEPELNKIPSIPLPSFKLSIYLVVILIIFLYSVKVYLRYGYLFGFSEISRLKKSYRAFLSILYDLGLDRNLGETRKEFAHRSLSDRKNLLTQVLTDTLYNHAFPDRFNTVKHTQQEVSEIYKKLSKTKKIILLFSLRATVAFLLGKKW
jgi:protein-glutamine gamma-glutamyltransferase